MNVYFIDPTYLKTDVLNALFNALKVKVAFSFIQENDDSAVSVPSVAV